MGNDTGVDETGTGGSTEDCRESGGSCHDRPCLRLRTGRRWLGRENSMGNAESFPEGSLGAVGSLKHRLQSLEETIQSIEVAHSDAQGDFFPEPGAADVCLYGARLACTPGVQVLAGPVIGEVTENSAVILLEVDIAPELGPTARVTCYVSLVDSACPRGRVVYAAGLDLPSRRPRAFRIGGGVSNVIGPGRAYTVCFGGISTEDARFRVGRFRTPRACFEPSLNVVAVSGDRPDRLAPGEPSLWRVLRERVSPPGSAAIGIPADSSSSGGDSVRHGPVDLVLHAGGQSWMADAFEDAWELLKRRAMQPVLCADGGWQEAQEEATERLREAMRRAWNLPDKRAVLSSVPNLMVSGAADFHPDFEGYLARVSSTPRASSDPAWERKMASRRPGGGKKGGTTSPGKQSPEVRALHAVVRACRRVYCEYQGQLLWKALSPGGGRGEDLQDLGAAFEAEETGVEEALAETRRVERDVTVKQKKVVMAEEALRRAKAAGRLPTEGGLRAAEERIDKIRKEAKAARARRMALATREVPTRAAAAADRASQGGFLNLGGSIGVALLETVWTQVSWDGRIDQARSGDGDGGDMDVGNEEAPVAPPLLSPRAWETLELELSRDSELRLLVVVIRHAIMGGATQAAPPSGAHDPASSNHNYGSPSLKGERQSSVKSGSENTLLSDATAAVPDASNRSGSWRDEKERLLDRLFAWKSGEAWREVVLVCGASAAERAEGRGGLHSACELEILDSKHPGCTIRQIVAGPITDSPRTAIVATTPTSGQRISSTLSQVTAGARRFSYKLSTPPGDDDDLASSKNFANSATPTLVMSAGAAAGAAAATTTSSPRHGLEGDGGTGGSTQEGKAAEATTVAPGWDDGGGANNSTDSSRLSSQPPTTQPPPAVATATRRQEPPVFAYGERSFLEAFLDGGHSPATAAAAGFDLAASARGVPASVVAEAVTITFVGATVVLGPVVGRVTQGSAVVLVEVGSTAAVGCVLTDGVMGWRHRQVRLLSPGQPYAFFFEALEESRHYTISLDGVDNANTRTGAFTTLKAWPDRREPSALRAAARLSLASLSLDQEGRDARPNHHGEGADRAEDVCDVRLLFVSGTGVKATTASGRLPQNDPDDGSISLPGGGGGGDGMVQGTERGADGAGTATDMWGVIGRELWRPWPQADVVVHTGSQVDLEVAVMEALPILAAAEVEDEGSEERQEAEEMAMERIRDAYRFQWSLPGARACLSCGSHLMLRGEADVGLPQLDCSRHTYTHQSATGRPTSAPPGKGGPHGEGGGGILGQQVSAYARVTLARLAAQAFSDYQRQLWDPLSVPLGLDMNDVGYARGGAGIDSDGFVDATAGDGGEWHFHVYGETVGLFALDVRHGSAGLQRDERAPLLSDAQWSSLARALSIEEIQVMVIVGDAPFVLDSVIDARAKARHPSNAHLRRSWPFHGGELLRLIGMLAEWKAAGGVEGEPREVTLIGGGLRYPLETVIHDSVTSVTVPQTVCGPFSGTPPLHGIAFELTGELSRRLSYRHTANDFRDKGGRGGQQHPGDALSTAGAGLGYKILPPLRPPSAVDRGDKPDENNAAEGGIAVRESDDPYRSPSCVLVLCEVKGAGPTSRPLLRNHTFTPASWAAWCDDGGSRTGAAGGREAAGHGTRCPRGAPKWAAKAGEEGEGREIAAPAVADADVLAALCAEGGPAEILAEAFEQLLDVDKDEDEDERLAAERGGTGDATRRVYESLVRVYDDVSCGRVRALCSTRPSPIVVRRLLKSVVMESPRPLEAVEEAQKASGERDDEAEVSRRNANGKKRGKARRAKSPGGRDGGGAKEGREGERGSLLPSWLLVGLPFHDDESFAMFFCEVLRDSQRLAARFGYT